MQKALFQIAGFQITAQGIESRSDRASAVTLLASRRRHRAGAAFLISS